MNELKPTQELIDLDNEVIACEKCRDVCIKMIFRTKSAIKYAKKAIKLRRKFWELSERLHPEIATGVWSFYHKEGVYKEKNEK
jgi:hypothetical protein